MGGDHRAPARGRPGQSRAAVGRAGQARRVAPDRIRRGSRERGAQSRPRAGQALPEKAHRVAAPGGDPRLLRRLHLPGGCRPARNTVRDGEYPDARWPDPAAGLPGSGIVRSSQPQPHSLAGAYVMNALDPAELRRVERHLARCQECAHEVADLREVVGCLAAASVSRPPAEFKARLIARTPMIRQLPPTVGQQQAGRWRYLPRPRWAGSWPKRMRRLASAPVLAAALALSVAVAALVIAVTGLPVQHRPPRQRHADAAITPIPTPPDAITISAAARTPGAA